jgi:hypothetical protein
LTISYVTSTPTETAGVNVVVTSTGIGMGMGTGMPVMYTGAGNRGRKTLSGMGMVVVGIWAVVGGLGFVF